MKEILYSFIPRGNQYEGLNAYSNLLPTTLISFFENANIEEDFVLRWKLYNTDISTEKCINLSFKFIFEGKFLYFDTFHGTKSLKFYFKEIEVGNFELWKKNNVFPFGDSGPFHFWCIGIAKENWGKIYYGHIEGEDVILIAENFDDFLEMFVFGYSNFDTDTFRK